MIAERVETRIYERRNKPKIIFQLASGALRIIGGASLLFACSPAPTQLVNANGEGKPSQTITTRPGVITRLPASQENAGQYPQPSSSSPTPPPDGATFSNPDSSEFASLLDGIGDAPDEIREWTLYAALIGSLTAGERDTYSTFVKDSTRMIKYLNSTPSPTAIGKSDIDVVKLRAQRPNSGINFQVHQFEKAGGILTLVNDGKEVVGFDLVRKSPKTSSLTPGLAYFETSAYVKPEYQQQGNFTRLRSLSIRGLAELKELAGMNWTITSRIINTKLAPQLSGTLIKLGYTIAKDDRTAYFSASSEQAIGLRNIPLKGDTTAVGGQKTLTIKVESVPADLPARISTVVNAPPIPKSGGSGKDPANRQPTPLSSLP